MKNKLILSLLFAFPLFLEAQIDLVGKWKIDYLISSNPSNTYQLKTHKVEFIYDNYGNFLELRENGTFTSYNSAQCGNDCFYTNSGKYFIKNQKFISFQLLHTKVKGDCENLDKKVNINIGTFEIIKTENTVSLVKINAKKKILKWKK